MLKNYEEAWDELKNRLENFLWALEHNHADKQRIKDTKGLIDKMEYFEKEIESQNIRKDE